MPLYPRPYEQGSIAGLYLNKLRSSSFMWVATLNHRIVPVLPYRQGYEMIGPVCILFLYLTATKVMKQSGSQPGVKPGALSVYYPLSHRFTSVVSIRGWCFNPAVSFRQSLKRIKRKRKKETRISLVGSCVTAVSDVRDGLPA